MHDSFLSNDGLAKKDNIFSIDYKNVESQLYWCDSQLPFLGDTGYNSHEK